jgi:hypothetical protein
MAGNLFFATMDNDIIHIYPYPTDISSLFLLESSYGGILAVNLSRYAEARKDSPMFESIRRIFALAKTESIIVLFPGVESVIQSIYDTYKPRAGYADVYDLNSRLYFALDQAILELALDKSNLRGNIDCLPPFALGALHCNP